MAEHDRVRRGGRASAQQYKHAGAGSGLTRALPLPPEHNGTQLRLAAATPALTIPTPSHTHTCPVLNIGDGQAARVVHPDDGVAVGGILQCGTGGSVCMGRQCVSAGEGAAGMAQTRARPPCSRQATRRCGGSGPAATFWQQGCCHPSPAAQPHRQVCALQEGDGQHALLVAVCRAGRQELGGGHGRRGGS